MNRLLRCLAAPALALWLLPSAAQAASAFVEAVQAELYGGRLAAAAAVAERQLETAPDDDQARFALGATRFLQAVERLGQGLYRHGLTSSEGEFGGLGILPIVRLPVPENPNPEKLTYEGFTAILDRFVADLAAADAALDPIKAGTLDLPLDIGRIRLDLDGDGSGSQDETLWRLFVQVAGAPELPEDADRLPVDFDRSDVPWLQGYCRLLMAIAEFPLAHDWRAAFDSTFHGLFPKAGLPSSALNDKVAAARAGTGGPPGDFMQFAGIVDLVAFLHLNNWPVVAPDRMQSVLAHLEAVPRLSRENWRLIRAETDDADEWIPSPKQSGALPGMQVTEEQVEGWMLFLDEFEALLQGRKLLPHWRFDQGINLRRIFTEPRTFDLVLLIQGAAALPYLEEGELTNRETWQRIVVLFGGQFFRYAVWFN